MAKGFTSLSEMRKNTGAFDGLMKEVEKLAQTGFEKDTRYWQPTVDKAGNGFAIIRFLPAPQGEDMPWVKLWTHGFKASSGSGKWYIENSLTTPRSKPDNLGMADPVSDLNSELWNSGIESNKAIAREQKRKLNFISNVLVVEDPGNPANEGKVFLFKYGKKLMDKIKEAMNPEFKDEQKINPFDVDVGANLKLKIRKVDGFRDYSKSEFEKPTPLAKTDEKIEEIWSKAYSLTEVIDPKNFKTYEELKKRLDSVLQGSGRKSITASDMKTESAPEAKSAPAPEAKSVAGPDAEEADEDSLDYFQKLANG